MPDENAIERGSDLPVNSPAPVESVPRRAVAIASEARDIAHRAKRLKNRGVAAAHAVGAI